MSLRYDFYGFECRKKALKRLEDAQLHGRRVQVARTAAAQQADVEYAFWGKVYQLKIAAIGCKVLADRT